MKLVDKLDGKEIVIFDRFYLGERAYGPVYRKHDLKDEQQLYLELALKKHNPIVIYCYQDVEKSKLLFKQEKEGFTREDDIEEIKFLFETSLQKSILPRFNFNFSKNKKEDVKLFLTENTRLEEKGLFSFLGSSRPRVLFLGDELNTKLADRNSIRHVFCSTSGMFLLKSFLDVFSKHDYSYLQVENSSCNGKTINLKDRKYTNLFKIICLGRKSHKRVKESFENIAMIPHPQFVKRFGGHDAQNIYTRIIKEAVNEFLS